ncbi:LacI family DNA-binding transcriptional regulator [Agathobaculum sp.]|uniref:LacI family DNA-binding transcriptional regulator n=1 Tax=Agathobaculum sp. TaxID=2048138 RepID=UPI002A82BBD3|nr:LacI family DNA-binding transcriptional regulator [Agathobaculum sp.]MDY3617500.1 LacI family DNA-binding transcriptional regulator [Agathobaculum sp.]
MAVTIRDVAALAGVSRGTVDRVLHGRPNVHPLVRQKVLNAAKSLGYRQPAPREVRKRAAMLIPPWTDGYFNRLLDSGLRRAKRYIGDPSFVLDVQPLPNMTAQALLRAVDKQLAGGVDGLILRPENTPEMREVIERAAGQGVSVVTYDADVPDSGRLCHVGQDLMRAGGIAAGIMAKLIRPPEHVLVVTGNMRLEAHKGRVDGFCRKLRTFGFGDDAYRIVEANEMNEVTSELVAQALTSDPRLRAIYMATQPIAGCIAGIRRSGCGQWPHVICNDLTPSAKRYLLEGQIDFVIGQAFDQEAFQAVLALYQMLVRGQKPGREVYYTDLSILSREML